MAATVISAVLVGGYVLFGLFSKPGAAEIVTDGPIGETQLVAALHPDVTASDEPRVESEGKASADAAVATSADAPAAKEASATPVGRFEPVPAFVSYNLGVQYYPRFATATFDRGIVLYRAGEFGPSAALAPPKPTTDTKRTKVATPAPRKPLPILPPIASAPPPPERRMPITAALTP
jgi:hypothetical protein